MQSSPQQIAGKSHQKYEKGAAQMIIKNGLLVNPNTNTSCKADIRIQNGIIDEISPDIPDASPEECLDAKGLTIAPGLIDTHVHFRDPGFPHKETLHTGSLAAARGGFTSVICMANTSPAVDSVPILQDILKRAKNEDIRIFQAGTVSQELKGKILTDMTALKEAGACGFTDDGIPVTDASFCYQAMQKAAALDVPISLHEEDPAFIRNNGINHGEISARMGLYGSPAIAEESLVARDCMLALRTGAHVVIQHISSKYSVELVRTFKNLGAHIHAEATPHHFSLTEDAVSVHGTLAKMNPPLRTEDDRLAIIQGLADGTIDLIATDHAPHSALEKEKPFPDAPSGIIGLETSLALGITNLVREGHLSLTELLKKMTVNPARLYHLPYGTIEKDSPADLVLFDPNERWIPEEYLSLSSNSPFTGKELYGKVRYTICRGKLVYAAP